VSALSRFTRVVTVLSVCIGGVVKLYVIIAPVTSSTLLMLECIAWDVVLVCMVLLLCAVSHASLFGLVHGDPMPTSAHTPTAVWLAQQRVVQHIIAHVNQHAMSTGSGGDVKSLAQTDATIGFRHPSGGPGGAVTVELASLTISTADGKGEGTASNTAVPVSIVSSSISSVPPSSVRESSSSSSSASGGAWLSPGMRAHVAGWIRAIAILESYFRIIIAVVILYTFSDNMLTLLSNGVWDSSAPLFDNGSMQCVALAPSLSNILVYPVCLQGMQSTCPSSLFTQSAVVFDGTTSQPTCQPGSALLLSVLLLILFVSIEVVRHMWLIMPVLVYMLEPEMRALMQQRQVTPGGGKNNAVDAELDAHRNCTSVGNSMQSTNKADGSSSTISSSSLSPTSSSMSTVPASTTVAVIPTSGRRASSVEWHSHHQATSVVQLHLIRFYRSLWYIPMYLYRPVLLITVPSGEAAYWAARSHWARLAHFVLVDAPFAYTTLILALAFQLSSYHLASAVVSCSKLAVDLTACWGQQLCSDARRWRNGQVKFA
jgi:hypothetical protein